jgi:hypothetical protein
VLEPGGVVVVTVPALPFLWSREDEVAGHHRRYTRRTLDAQLAACGFARISCEYLFASLVLPAFLLRALPYRFGRRRSQQHVQARNAKQLAPNARVDALAGSVLRAERAVGRVVPLPVGLSVLGTYRATA